MRYGRIVRSGEARDRGLGQKVWDYGLDSAIAVREYLGLANCGSIWNGIFTHTSTPPVGTA